MLGATGIEKKRLLEKAAGRILGQHEVNHCRACLSEPPHLKNPRADKLRTSADLGALA